MDTELYWSAVLRQDAAALTAFFTEDAEVRWPCTGERFTVEGFVRANCLYPGDWDGRVERVQRDGDVLITVAKVWPRDRSASFHVTSFMSLRDGLIAQLEEYWADDGPPPEWRRRMGVSLPMEGD